MNIFVTVAILLSIIISAAHACEPCAADEYCDISSCACDLTLSEQTDSDPAPTIDCSGGKLNVYISKCWLEKNGYESTTIRLVNNTCIAAREIVNNTASMTLHTKLSANDCGSLVTANESHVIYANWLYIYAKTNPIQTRRDVIMNIFCAIPLNITDNPSATLNPRIGSTQIEVPGTTSSFTVNMLVYKDPDFIMLLTENEDVYIESTLYVSVIIPSLDVEIFKIKVLDIMASAPESNSSYYLLQNGCLTTGLTADLMRVLSNAISSEARFAVKVFQIAGFPTVALSANIKICIDDCPTNCTIGAKSAPSEGKTSLVSVFLTADNQNIYDGANCFTASWTVSSLLFSLLLVKLI